METCVVTYEAELSAGVWTDISADVLPDPAPHYEWGFQSVGPTDLVGDVGVARFVLNNSDGNSGGLLGYYTPGHTNCRAGWADGTGIRLKIAYGGTDYYKWVGKVSSITPSFGKFRDRRVEVGCVDWMDQALAQNISQVAIQTSKRVDQLIPSLLAEVTIQPRATSYATGVETFDRFFDTDSDAKNSVMSMFQKLARNEYGYVYVKGGSCPAGLNVDLRLIAPYDGSPDSNQGHTGTPTGGVIYLTGKHGQGLQIAKATVNYCLDPSFEVNVTDDWTFAGAGAVRAQDLVNFKVGAASCKLTAGTAASTLDGTTGVVVPDTATVTIHGWIRWDGAGMAGGLRLRDVTSGVNRVAGLNNTVANTWEYVTGTWTNNTGAPATCTVRCANPNLDGTTVQWCDACQLELQAAATPYCDGTLGTGHSWAGTAHNSLSSRTVATLTYPNPLSTAGGSLLLWWKPSANNTGPTRYLFSEGNLKAYFNAADDKICFTDGTNTISTDALTFSADVLQHLVFTWGTAGLQIIRNGVSAASGGIYTAPTLGPTLYVGSDTSGANQEDGLADDLGVAFYAITVAQANAIYGSSDDLTTYHATQEILRFDSRHTRALNRTSAFTLDNRMGELEVEYARSNVFNLVRVNLRPKKIDTGATTVLYTGQLKFSIAAGQSTTVICPFRDPTAGSPISASDVVDPLTAPDVDFKFGSSEGTANDLNASLGIVTTIGGNSARLVLTNNASVAGYMNLLQLRGNGIYAYDPQIIEASDAASILARGELLLDYNLEQHDNPTVGAAWAAYIKNRFGTPTMTPKRVSKIANDDATLMAALLAAEPSTLFTLIETMTGLNSNYYINGITLDIEQGNVLRFGLLAVPADMTNFFIWDTSHWDVDTYWAF